MVNDIIVLPQILEQDPIESSDLCKSWRLPLDYVMLFITFSSDDWPKICSIPLHIKPDHTETQMALPTLKKH